MSLLPARMETEPAEPAVAAPVATSRFPDPPAGLPPLDNWMLPELAELALVSSAIEPVLALELDPEYTSTDPPNPEPLPIPADNSTLPPTPDKDEPTTRLIEPPWPLVAKPVASRIAPLF